MTGAPVVPSGRIAQGAHPHGRAVKAVVFDMDGVLVDSEPLHHAAVNAVLEAEGQQGLTMSQYARYLGNTETTMWRDLTEQRGLPGVLGDYLSRYDAMIVDIYRRCSVPNPGVVELLTWIRAHGLSLAVASSSPSRWIAICLDSLHIGSFFDVVVGGDMVLRGKPDPAIYRLAAERLGLSPVECLAIEDSPNGIAAALAAGMTAAALHTPYTTPTVLADAHLQLQSLDEEATRHALDPYLRAHGGSD
jgi:HAD superfamily hydrolase (TIGR01509 family)